MTAIANPIIAESYLHPRAFVGGEPSRDEDTSRHFKIRAADDHGQRSSTNILIKRRYEWRGYQNVALPTEQAGHRITLCATEEDEVIGTITVGLDGADGLYAEDAFCSEVQALRKNGIRICEFTKLAMGATAGSKHVLASLFHVAYTIAHRIRGFDMLLMEVNPRHVAYYRRMLGCQILGAERLNRRVSAPAVLLSLDLNYTREQIRRLGGRPEQAACEKSLYPFAFSEPEEAGIIDRLNRSVWPGKPS
ncbi:MAG: long-chain N-acyl amino acid synthase [Methylibium sp.]|uniref:N-acyl amino acid synthase FeeM domain-containing protein n=1 Tax=Methylibium sp. TaxID=2067992 RepID=UPI0017D4B7C2|nr:long-chain N-acyl amino acid synthase [Methylibium sp.]MBA3596212.1 long-chain N-acyl amino acid synthase [Methylibium sp.]